MVRQDETCRALKNKDCFELFSVRRTSQIVSLDLGLGVNLYYLGSYGRNNIY